MKALCWCGAHKVQIEDVAEPTIINPRDAVVRITSTAICGSDLHLYNGFVPTMAKGDILGHEFMGEIVALGRDVANLHTGDRVVIPFTIACGNCFYCKRELYSLCDNSNPNSWVAEKVMGFSPAGIFGYSHMLGGYAGGQAQYARVPYADTGAIKVPPALKDEQVLLLSDILPTGYMAAENANIQKGDIVAVWGCGPVGQLTIMSAKLLGAAFVIAIDSDPLRLEMATDQGVITINYNEESVYDRIFDLTGGLGADCCIDAVGLEAHGTTVDALIDRAKTKLALATDRPHVLRQAIHCCRKGGTLSLIGVYVGLLDKVPMGAAFNKGLTIRMGQTNVQKYMRPLLERIENGEIDPSFVITHRLPLSDAPAAYEMFRQKDDGCVKVILDPWA